MSDLGTIPTLVGALAVAPLVGGRWNVPVAAWLLPAFLLTATHAMPTPTAYAVAVGVLSVGGLVSLAGQVPLPGPAFVGMVVATEAVGGLAFLAGHVALNRIDGFAATLVFPAAVVALEMTTAATSPFGRWGSLAYTQVGNQPLTQAAALGGNHAITALVAWFGSTVAWAGAHEFALNRVAGGVAIYAGVLAVTVLIGGVRLARTRRLPVTVRVSSVTEPDLGQGMSTKDVMSLMLADADIADGDWIAIGQSSRAINDYLLDQSARQAAAGARIVFWAEAAGLVPADEEPQLVRRGARLARDHACYLAMSLAVVHRAGPRHLENKVVLATPTGDVAFSYRKRRPVPGVEATHSVPSDQAMPWIDTPFGRVGVLICFDVDIPRVARQVAAAGVDIVLVPASDWPAIDPTHSQMAALRGVEHGASVVRQTRWGLSLATDAYGRVLAAHDHRVDGAANVLTASVPTRAAWTLSRALSRHPSTSTPRPVRVAADARGRPA